MNPRRCAQVTTALCGTVGLAGWVVASLTDLGSSGIGNAGAVPIDELPSPVTARSWTHRRQPHWAALLSPALMRRRSPNW